MSPKHTNDHSEPKPVMSKESPAKQAEPVLTAASVSLDRPVELKAQAPAVDLAAEFAPKLRGEEELRTYTDKFIRSQIDHNRKHLHSGNHADRLRIHGSLMMYERERNRRVAQGIWSDTLDQ